MQKRIASLMAVGLLLMAACGTGDEVEPGPVTSFEDIAGTYERQGPGGPGFMQFFEDETFWHSSANRDLVEDRPTEIMGARFEGTRVLVKNSKGRCVDKDAIAGAIYEIHLLENGNLQFVLIEDTCAWRSTQLQAEYAPVP
ncbi:MAG: hypothetical protein V3V29_03570 [Acidimicrobiia bacterium]